MTWRAGHYVAAGALAAGMLVWAAHEAWPSREIPVALPIVVTSAYDEWADTLGRGQVFSDVLARGGITGREYVAFMKATHTLNPRRMQPGLIFQLRRVKGAAVAEAAGDGGALHAAQLEDQPGLHAPGIECVRGFHECDVLAAGDPAPCQHVGKHLTASEGIGPLVVGARHHDRQRDGNLAGRPCFMRSPDQHTSGERAGSNVMTRPPRHQSICLRMKVGISISFSSGFSGAWAPPGPRLGATSDGFANPGGTGVGLAARSRNGSTPAAGRCTPASASAMAPVLSNPVAMTVIRTSPCIAGSFTAPKMISASSPAAS